MVKQQGTRHWFKSSFSGETSCVEVRLTGDKVQVRNTRDRDGAALEFTRGEWEAFLLGAAGASSRPPDREGACAVMVLAAAQASLSLFFNLFVAVGR